MTDKDKHLNRIAIQFSQSRNYPNLTTDQIRACIRKAIGPSTMRQLFKFLAMVQSHVKASDGFTFDVSRFCDAQLENYVK